MAFRVFANLQCELDGQPVTVVAEARKIVVEVPDVATGLKILQLGSLRDFARPLSLLDSLEVTFEIRTSSTTLVAAGHEVSSWWLSRLHVHHLRLSRHLLVRLLPLLLRSRLRLRT